MMTDLTSISIHHTYSRCLFETHWKPMWVWIRIVAQSRASVIGLRVPAANGVMMRGTKSADIALKIRIEKRFQ